MLPSQFNPLNYFGIDGDIIRVDKLYNSDLDVDSSNKNLSTPDEISFYNINPNKTYEYIDIDSVFGDGSAFLTYINFYNFNQNELKLYIPYDRLSVLFSKCYFLKKLNFDGTIIIYSHIDSDVDNLNIDYIFRHLTRLDFSNIIIRIRAGGETVGSASFFAATSNIFGNYNSLDQYEQGASTPIKDLDVELYNYRDLSYAFYDALPAKNYDFNKLLGIKNIDTNTVIKTYYIDYICDNSTDIFINPYNGITNFFSNVPFNHLSSGYIAFSALELHKTDVKTLANNLPTYTSGERNIGVGIKDSTITEQELTEIENMYTTKGWTLSLNQLN